MCSYFVMPAVKPRTSGIKAQAAKLVRALPESASWDDLMYEIYVRQKIDSGLADIAAGRVKNHAAICKKFGLTA
jgi:predicted transcriptional regulator